jgi:glycosyltransferase involved in cell wall biosynthesis
LQSDKIKLAIVGSRGYPYVYGGYETFVKELSERLIHQNIDITVYCQSNLFNKQPKQANGINLLYIPTVKLKSLNQLIHSFLSMLHVSLSDADVVLVVNLAAGPLGWLPRLFGKKTIINTDGLEWERPKWKGLGSKYFYFGAWCATKFYHVLVSDAEAMRQVYLQKFKAESEVIAYGAPNFKERNSEALEKFSLEPYSYYLIVGRLIPDNNADFIIKEFLNANSSKKLVVIGDVPYKDDYANSLKALACNQLVFTGYVKNQDDLLSLYQYCFVYLHGHEFGGTNPAMLKAMANQCAILALNTRFNQEMLNNGEFGLFFDKKEKSLITKMNEIEQSPELVESLRKQVNNGLGDKYNWEFVSGQYINLMNKLLRRNSL